jgi:hypothetical protein
LRDVRNAPENGYHMNPLALIALASAVSIGPGPSQIIRTDNLGQRALVAAPREQSQTSLTAESPEEVGFSRWQALGPFGGDISSAAISPVDDRIVLAGLAPSGGLGGRMYRSTDGGATWNRVAAFAQTSVFDIAFTPNGIAFAGAANGVWKSTDDGQSWRQLSLGVGFNSQVLEVTIDPRNSGLVWAGVSDAFGAQPATVVRSMNGGDTWTDVTPPMKEPLSCRGIAVDPNDSDAVAACFGGGFVGGAVWFSNDGGQSWVDRSAGLPSNPMNAIVHDGTRWLVAGGLTHNSQDVGLYASEDDGETWTALHSAEWPSLVINDIEIDSSTPGVIQVASAGAGVFRSSNGGGDWEFGFGDSGFLTVNSVRFHPSDSDRSILGCATIGVMQSEARNSPFQPSSFGIDALAIASVSVNPNDPDEYAVAVDGLNDGAVFTSRDAGTTWTMARLPGTRYSAVAFSGDGMLHTTSDGPATIAPEGVYRRDATGQWGNLGPDQGPLFETQLLALGFSAADPGLILAGGSDFGVAGTEGTIWRSVDRGENWTKAYEGTEPNERVTDVAMSGGGTPAVLLATFVDVGTNDTGGVMRSVDGGQSWSASGSGLPSTSRATAIVAAASDPDVFYIADASADDAGGGVYRTEDAGLSWTHTGYAISVLDVALGAIADNALYVVSDDANKVLRSFDGGANFSPFSAGLDEAGTITAITRSLGTCPLLLAASETGVHAIALPPASEADADVDGDVDVLDFAAFEGCSSGAETDGCCVFDLDRDNDVDLADYAAFQLRFTGPL